MHPILFKFGPLVLGTYGLVVAIGVFAAIWLGRVLSRREGLNPEEISDFFVYSVIAGFVGAKIALIIGDFREFSERPLAFLLENLRSFGAFYGGFIAAFLVALVYIKKKKLPFWEITDITAVCLALSQGIGRWGCFFAGCCHGSPTTLPWGMNFPYVDICADGTRIHPWPVYESILDFAIFGFLLYFFPKRKFKGQIFILYAIIYALGRGFLEFFRGDAMRGLYFNNTVSLSQILAITILLVAIPYYFIKRKQALNENG
jgi:phosphatidylglycerol---prolipoprotein diacylglyceryl transferase